MWERAVLTHLITSQQAVPLMRRHRGGLIIEITDGVGDEYRGNLAYDLTKQAVNRLALAQAEELREYGITALAVTPGFLRSEAMLDNFEVTEANWRAGVAKDPHFAASETPHFVGRALAALAADPKVSARSGKVLTSWDLAEEYGITDVDGSRPHWGRHFQETRPPGCRQLRRGEDRVHRLGQVQHLAGLGDGMLGAVSPTARASAGCRSPAQPADTKGSRLPRSSAWRRGPRGRGLRRRGGPPWR